MALPSPKLPEILSSIAPVWDSQTSGGGFGEQPSPAPHRTPAPTPGNQFCQEDAFLLQHQRPLPEPAPPLLAWQPGAFTEPPGLSSKSPCPDSHTPLPAVPEAPPLLVTAGSCGPVTGPCTKGLCHQSACRAALFLGLTTPR